MSSRGQHLEKKKNGFLISSFFRIQRHNVVLVVFLSHPCMREANKKKGIVFVYVCLACHRVRERVCWGWGIC